MREVRDEIEDRVRDLVATRLDAIRTDRTSHELRLARLLPLLGEEFDGRRSAGEIRLCLDSVLGEFEEAPVRSFVETIALRRARACLTEESCGALAAR